MSEVEKRELFEQQRNIFEAGAQRANKRAGSFGFLTWPFFIAPLIAGEEFLAATFNSAAAEEHAKAALAGAAQQAANDDPPVHDPSKSSTEAEDEMAERSAVLSETHVALFDPTELAQPQKDVAKPSTARSEEAIAAAGGGGGGGGGGGDDADSRHHDAHTSIDDNAVNLLSADSNVGSGQSPGGSTLGLVQSQCTWRHL